MAESFYQYFLNVWLSPFTVHLVRAIEAAIAIVLFTLLTNWRLKRALRGALRRDTGREPSERIRRRRIVEGLPVLINTAVLNVVGILMVLRILGLPTGAELLPGVLVVVLLALVILKDHLRDAARGYYIMYDNLYGPGDRVTIGELTGVVTDLGLRTTRLRTGEGQEVVIPNRRVQSLVNHSRGAPREAKAPEGPS